MTPQDYAKNWDLLAERDPFWAVLSYPEKEGRKWTAEEFFATGEKEISEVMTYVQDLGISLHPGPVLDFGCGVGRLTQALGSHFELCYGVDISPKMIEIATSLNRQGLRCQYLANKAGDLSLFPGRLFSFVYSNIVLQHIPRKYSLFYISEFLRIIKPGGIVLFQVPSESQLDKPLLARIKRALKKLSPSPVYGAYRKIMHGSAAVIERHCIRREEVEKHLRINGGRILDVTENREAGPNSISFRYAVTMDR